MSAILAEAYGDSAEDDYWGSEDEEYYDELQQEENEEHYIAASQTAPQTESLENYEREIAAKRQQLERENLALLSKGAMHSDDSVSLHSLHGVEKKANKDSVEALVMRAALYADGNIRWDAVSLGKGTYASRVDAAYCVIPNPLEKSMAIAIYGGRAEDGSQYGDGLFIEVPDAETLGSTGRVKLATRAMSLLGHKPKALVGHSLNYFANDDLLICFGGSLRTSERSNQMYVLRHPLNTTSSWGIKHPPNKRVAAMFEQGDPRYQDSTHCCECFPHRVTSHGRSYNQIWTGNNARSVPNFFETHYAKVVVVGPLPAVSFHTATIRGSSLTILGGKMGANKMNDRITTVSCSLRTVTAQPSVISRVNHRSGTFRYAPVYRSYGSSDEACDDTFVPVAGHAAVLVTVANNQGANRLFLIGGKLRNGDYATDIIYHSQDGFKKFKLKEGRLPPIAYHSATLAGNNIIVFGGVTGSGVCLNNIYVISLLHKTVDQLIVTQGHAPVARSRHAAVLLNGKDLLIFGGITSKNTVAGATLLRNIASLKTQDAFVQSFRELLNDSTYSDVTFINSKLKIQAHRVMLNARSDFFGELIQNGAKNETLDLIHCSTFHRVKKQLVTKKTTKQGAHSFTLMLDVPHTELNEYLNFLYADKADLTQCNLKALTAIALDFGCDALAAMCRSVEGESLAIPASSFVADLRSLLNQKTFSDITFLVGTKTIHAHRALLTHSCPYFATLLGGNFREASEKTVTIHDYEPDLFLAALQYIYSGFVDSSNAQQVFELLYVSNFWGMPQLKAKCETILSGFMGAENCCLFYEAAVECNCSTQFTHYAKTYVQKSFSALVGGVDADVFLDQVARMREAAENSDDEDAHNPLIDGWIPRANQMCKCGLPMLYNVETWPKDKKTPMTLINDWATSNLKKNDKMEFQSVVDPVSVGHRIHVHFSHLAKFGQVKLLRSFRTKKVAQQNAALCALHHLHLLADKL